MRSTTPARLLDALVLGRAYQRVARALSAFGALVLPSSCVVCGRWDASLCPVCLGAFRRATARPFRAEAGAESLPDVELPVPGERTAPGRGRPAPGAGAPAFGPLPVLAAGRYGSAVSVVLLAFKNHGHVDLAVPVASALGGVLHAAAGAAARPSSGPVLLVPVPTRASSRRRRGYDPLMLLLSRLDRSGRLPAATVLAPAVRQLPATRRLTAAFARGGVPALVPTASAVLAGLRGGQKGLGRRRRRAGVLHSMGTAGHARRALAGRDCLIVDDVLTTGATIGEVHRVLAAAGARVLGAVVVAATSPPAGGDPGTTPGAGDVAHRAPDGPPEFRERRRVNKGQA
ncbi:ComF family protein [Arthrobacter sp. B0490]|uniref:ComF family protein n=1 Tax=Arthrobacter sp. B0490 TaxID=2058891 RepID=UPI000CE39E7F|nr:phosphoribosyltransferase family protein [Arthrobacter sp. B0490]